MNASNEQNHLNLSCDDGFTVLGMITYLALLKLFQGFKEDQKLTYILLLFSHGSHGPSFY